MASKENESKNRWILPEDLDCYFTADECAFDVDIDLLTATRRRPEGVENAAQRMAAAYRNEHPKREPITVRPDGVKGFVILDGNSTFAVAKASGWRRLRCKLT